MTKAKWDLPVDQARDITFCDSDGRLSVSAVAASANGKQLEELLLEGIELEVLSWKMDLEEPNAAAVISQALNKSHELALWTTEITALNTLKGEIVVQMGAAKSQKVAYQSVRESIKQRLDSAVDDPDLPELFEFLMSRGVGQNAYLDDFFEFAGATVDS